MRHSAATPTSMPRLDHDIMTIFFVFLAAAPVRSDLCAGLRLSGTVQCSSLVGSRALGDGI